MNQKSENVWQKQTNPEWSQEKKYTKVVFPVYIHQHLQPKLRAGSVLFSEGYTSQEIAFICMKVQERQG